jgi:hypothetical protein
MRALLDIEAAAEAKSLSRVALFIARPLRIRQESDLRAIDYVACRAPRHCRVEVEEDTSILAAQIV